MKESRVVIVGLQWLLFCSNCVDLLLFFFFIHLSCLLTRSYHIIQTNPDWLILLIPRTEFQFEFIVFNRWLLILAAACYWKSSSSVIVGIYIYIYSSPFSFQFHLTKLLHSINHMLKSPINLLHSIQLMFDSVFKTLQLFMEFSLLIAIFFFLFVLQGWQNITHESVCILKNSLLMFCLLPLLWIFREMIKYYFCVF